MHDYGNSPVPGQMMRRPLLIASLLQHAARHRGTREIVSGGEDGSIHRYTWRDCEERAARMASSLSG